MESNKFDSEMLAFFWVGEFNRVHLFEAFV